MPRVRIAQRYPKLKVDVSTHKCMGAVIYCRSCHYEGQADVVAHSRRNERFMERCPQCMSLNIRVAEDVVDEETTWQVDEWTGCYPSSWKGVIVPEAMSHPAKFSSKLIRRIYEHLFEEGFVKEGDRVLDPFGGVALGALHAQTMGLAWVGCELEPKFVDIGRHNLSQWNIKYKLMPKWSGKASLLQGDSRKLLQVIGEQSAISDQQSAASVSSPPYKNDTQGGGLNVDKPESFRGVLKDGTLSMGESEGNLGQMDDGNFQASISSPPFRQSEGGTPEPKPGGVIDERLQARHSAGNSAAAGYGESDGQLANMKERAAPGEKQSADSDQRAADSEDKDDFWLAARQIVDQVFLALAPGGVAVWVVKDFVRNKERVSFSDQWRQLCEAAGFETLHEHLAMLVNHKGTSLDFDGNTVEHKTESKSFFRRIAEKKGSPRIDWETVWCMRKPMESGDD